MVSEKTTKVCEILREDHPGKYFFTRVDLMKILHRGYDSLKKDARLNKKFVDQSGVERISILDLAEYINGK